MSKDEAAENYAEQFQHLFNSWDPLQYSSPVTEDNEVSSFGLWSMSADESHSDRSNLDTSQFLSVLDYAESSEHLSKTEPAQFTQESIDKSFQPHSSSFFDLGDNSQLEVSSALYNHQPKTNGTSNASLDDDFGEVPVYEENKNNSEIRQRLSQEAPGVKSFAEIAREAPNRSKSSSFDSSLRTSSLDTSSSELKQRNKSKVLRASVSAPKPTIIHQDSTSVPNGKYGLDSFEDSPVQGQRKKPNEKKSAINSTTRETDPPFQPVNKQKGSRREPDKQNNTADKTSCTDKPPESQKSSTIRPRGKKSRASQVTNRNRPEVVNLNDVGETTAEDGETTRREPTGPARPRVQQRGGVRRSERANRYSDRARRRERDTDDGRTDLRGDMKRLIEFVVYVVKPILLLSWELVKLIVDTCYSIMVSLWSLGREYLLDRLSTYMRHGCSQLWKRCCESWLRFRTQTTQAKPKEKEPVYSANLPTTGDDAIRRLLSLKDRDAYSVLGVLPSADDKEINRCYKKQAILVHPDKNKSVGAEEAFKVLGDAFSSVADPVKRSRYDAEVLYKEEFDAEWKDFVTKIEELQEKLQHARNQVPCTGCDQRHERIPVDRDLVFARYCSSCGTRHVAREGDVWAETSWLGFRWHYYACMEGKVFNITHWAECQRESFAPIQPNTHVVMLRLQTQKTQNSRRNVQRPDYMDLLNRVFDMDDSGPPPTRQQQTSRQHQQQRRKAKRRR